MPALKPSEVTKLRQEQWPEAVFNVINSLIATNWDGTRAKFKLKTLKAYLDEVGFNERQFWDFEDIYREAGWKIEFDSPGYNESYDAYFVLSL